MRLRPNLATPRQRLAASREMLRAGAGSRATRSGAGRATFLSPPPAWRHPWYTQAIYTPGTGWQAVIKPGFLNGDCPIVETTVANAPAATWPDFGINPLNGLPFFSADVFNQQNPANTPPTTPIWIPLYATPLITCVFYPLGWDAPGTAVPQFFQNLGVNAAQPLDPDDIDQDAADLDDAPPTDNRLLRACDFVLHQPRAALTSTVTLLPGIATGTQNVSQTLGIAAPSPTDTLKVYAAAPWAAPTAAAGIDPLTGDYTEADYDEILISTLFFLGPAGAAPFSSPDETWTPYPRHNLFWNLNWAQPELVPLPQDPGTQNLGLTGLAGGVADLDINFLTAGLTDATNQMLNIVSAHSLAGFFWTPTGGGTASVFPPPASSAPVQGPGGGLDKDGRLQQQRIAAAQALAQQQLDPDFPYTGQQFNLSLMSS